MNMDILSIIEKKQRRLSLSDEEIAFAVRGAADGSIPDYQLSAFLMAVWFNGMTDAETAAMTICMAQSGDMLDLSAVDGIKADKHSTGGIGDKTTLIACPLAASAGCGVRVAKLSGRALGYTGGTIDKLESIPGFRTSLSAMEFISVVNRTGICIAGQTGSLVPADKRLYALRDVTSTVDSIPLIAASVMSKKLAGGSDVIVLDVKFGSGAFMKTPQDAEKLARLMVSVGNRLGRRTAALITDMDEPLGRAVGNSLEVAEACRILSGEKGGRLAELSKIIAAEMLSAAGAGSPRHCRELADGALASGRALETLAETVAAQGGDASYVYDPSRFGTAAECADIVSQSDGYVARADAGVIGRLAYALGAGRPDKDARIDSSAGVLIRRERGEYVKKGEVLATLYSQSRRRVENALAAAGGAFVLSDSPPEPKELVYKIIRQGDV